MAANDRRARLERMVPAERLLRSAKMAVEGLGVDPRLARAAGMISDAINLVGDYVDEAGDAAQVPPAQVSDPNFMRNRRRGVG